MPPSLRRFTTSFALVLVAVLLTAPALAQRTGASFGGRAWGSRAPTTTTTTATRPSPTPSPARPTTPARAVPRAPAPRIVWVPPTWRSQPRQPSLARQVGGAVAREVAREAVRRAWRATDASTARGVSPRPSPTTSMAPIASPPAPADVDLSEGGSGCAVAHPGLTVWSALPLVLLLAALATARRRRA